MGVGWIYLKTLIDRGIFLKGSAKVLDIGFQALYDIPLKEGAEFARSHGFRGSEFDLRSRLLPISERSVQRQLHLNEYFGFVGIEYTAYEIFEGPNTRIFDLNFESVRKDHVGYFDVTLNFGTTEHVFNQYNSFKVIHDATKRGGYMFHQVPMTGFINHGFWTYSPRVFLDLANANSYEVMECWIGGPQGAAILPDVVQGVSWDADRLPSIHKGYWDTTPVPNGLINVLLRKTFDGPFRLSLDVTTSDAQPTTGISDNYS